jgi:hypothetical protein
VVQYDTTHYDWRWNDRSNLYGYENGVARFIWQPHGSQFSVVEDVPDNVVKLILKPVKSVPKKAIVKFIGFDESSYSLV